MERLLADLRSALRPLRRQRTLSLMVILLIALGIGLDVALFSVVRATLLRPLPFDEPDEVVVVVGTYEEASYWSLGVPELRDLEERSEIFERIGIYSAGWPLTLTGDGPARSLDAGYASADFFRVLGSEAVQGRTFLDAEDDGLGAHPVAVLDYDFWHTEMAGDPAAVGRNLNLGGHTYTVVGVLDPSFRFADMDVWLPLSMGGPAFGSNFYTSRPSRYHFGVARLPAASHLPDADRETAAVMGQLMAELPDLQKARGAELVPLREFFYGSVDEPVRLLFAGAGLVLLICCVNVGALLLVRALARRREMAVRTALGASSARLLRAFLLESLVLTAAGGLLGILIARVALRLILASFDLGLPAFTQVELDRPVLMLAVGLVLVVGILLGIWPALRLRLHSPIGALRDGGRQIGSGRGAARQRAAVIALEVAVASMLLVGAGLTAKSFTRLVNTDLGFDTRNLVSLRLDLRGPQFNAEDGSGATAGRARFAAEVERQIEALPGVVETTLWGPSRLGAATRHIRLAAEGTDIEDEAFGLFSQRLNVNPGGLAKIGIPVVAGRGFTSADAEQGGGGVAVIDTSLAAALFPEGDALGKRLYRRSSAGDDVFFTVVGIAADVRHRGRRTDDAEDGVAGDFYYPIPQHAAGHLELLIRTEPGLAAGAIAQSARRAVERVDADVPVFGVTTVEASLGRRASIPRFAAILMAVYAAVAALLAFVGTYGVLAYTVRLRRGELAVRAALGADRRRVTSLVLSQGLRPVLAGMALGIPGALALSRLVEGVLFEVERTDPAVYLAVVVGVASASWLACYLPARRAAATDPASVLRHD